jgi:hypothetical protein
MASTVDSMFKGPIAGQMHDEDHQSQTIAGLEEAVAEVAFRVADGVTVRPC